MKSLYLFIFAMFALNTQAAETRESTSSLLNRIVTVKPAALNADKYEDYSAEKDSAYKGRVDNRAKERLNARTTISAGMSRNIVLNSSKNSAQLENLEATVGELVQKLEDDRQKKLKNHASRYDDNADTLKATYNVVSQIETDKLGSEQDPIIQNAFKCYDLKACNKKPELAKGNNDKHSIPECDTDERLHWNAKAWKCVGVFESSKPFTGCKEHQYEKVVNGGRACIDYVYFWKLGSYGSCQPNNTKIARVECRMKEKVSSTSSKKANNSKYCLAEKPKDKVASCSYIKYTSWSVGSWSSCNKSCGGGSQTRSVSCRSGFSCTGSKPATSQSCNTQVCTSSWNAGSWGSCSKSCGGGSQTRSVTCPSGFSCTGAKPATSQSCNTQVCTSSWNTGSWGSCSKSCGGGSQTRSVTCPSGFSCTGTKPATSQSCNTQVCTASWNAGSWGSCSKSCGGGSQRRSVTCPSGFSCTGAKPATSQSCNTTACAPIPPIYKCPTGYSLSGSSCTKSSTVCKYNENRDYVVYSIEGAYVCYNTKQKYKYLVNGRSIGLTKSRSLNGYTVGSLVRSFNCGGGSSGASEKVRIYKICGKEVSTINATATCKSGYIYNSSINKCQK